jgi:hypothetical protein
MSRKMSKVESAAGRSFLHDEAEENTMSDAIKCPIMVGNIECGREEIINLRKAMGRRPGMTTQIIHHKCELHKFHIVFPGGNWEPCNCPD